MLGLIQASNLLADRMTWTLPVLSQGNLLIGLDSAFSLPVNGKVKTVQQLLLKEVYEIAVIVEAQKMTLNDVNPEAKIPYQSLYAKPNGTLQLIISYEVSSCLKKSYEVGCMSFEENQWTFAIS